MKPMILINFKTYETGTGKRALEIARIADKLANKYNANIALAVQATDIRMISDAVEIPVYAQHIDPIEYGSNTGWTLAQSVKEAGAEGTLINHSEHRLEISEIEKVIDIANGLELKTVACASDPEVAGALGVFKPDYVAVEPPELIAGDKSVSSAKPEVITDSIKMVKRINPEVPVFVGAGIKNCDDVKKAIELGAQGVLLASGVMKSDDPEKEITDIIYGVGGKSV